ncbi:MULTISPECIES: glycosyltransferase family 61 protein [Rhodomicrobium]|uniref:glycosyltransferase family 61 protein n=1 Tax=Rhodomicrobium TaxID=1068 RepID=UPI00148257E0|nr:MULTISPECIES: glycosyltransferase family 61 protein [Rhodomicrobium]
MAWPSQKSSWRRRLNGRWLRWALWRTIFRVVPVAEKWSFPLASVTASSIAAEKIDDVVSFADAAFDDARHGEILRGARRNDKIVGPSDARRERLFRRQMAVIPRCAVLGHVGAVISAADGRMLSLRGHTVPNRNQARPRRLAPRAFDDGLVTWLEGAGHYFHFFASLLPLLTYLEREHAASEPLTVLVPADGPLFQRQVCAAVAAAYPAVRFEGLGKGERAEVSRYLWLHHASDNAEWLPVDRKAAARLTGLVRAHYGLAEPRGGGQMFFSRGDAKQRRLLNEAELEAVAAAKGFARFEAHAGNHREQVRAFGDSDMIVAVHGAGLTNLLFARPGTTVIEIFPENCVKSTYLWLALKLGLDYRAVLGKPGDYHQAFRLPPGKFAAALEDASRSRQERFERQPALSPLGLPLRRATG